MREKETNANYIRTMDNLRISSEAMEENLMLYQDLKGKVDMRIKTIIGVMAGAAACVALAAGMYLGNMGKVQDSGENGSIGAFLSEKTEGVKDRIENAFTLKVLAAEPKDGEGEPSYTELTEGKAVTVFIDANSLCWGLSANEEDGKVFFNLELQMNCEGDNIESITYSIDNALFQIIQPEEDSGEEIIITDGIDAEHTFYKSYTVAYDKQSDSHTWINICSDAEGRYVNNFMRLFDTNEADSAEDELAAYRELFDGIVIHCTVTFEDGTTDTKDIALDAEVLPYEEVYGTPEIAEGYADWALKETVVPVYRLMAEE